MNQQAAPFWTQSYPAGAPATIDADSNESIVDLFERSVKDFGDKIAFECMGASVSYGELDGRARAFGAFLRSQGLGHGDRVALMMPNLIQYPVALFGALREGMVVVNVNPLYTPRELEHQLADSGAKALVIVENFAATFQKVAERFADLRVVTTEVGDMMPAPKRWLVNFVAKRVKKMVPAFSLPGSTDFLSALALGGRLSAEPARRPSASDLAFLQYTGGTTGVAKGAMLTHANIVANLRQSGAWISGNFERAAEVAVSPLPLYHIFCLTSTLCFMTWGAKNILIPNPRDLAALSKLLRHTPWTILTGVNTLFNGLLRSDRFERADFSKAKLCLGGGAPVQRSVAQAWRSATGMEITEAYGLTETSPGVAINPIGAPHRGSIGLPLPSTEVSIRGGAFEDLGPWDGQEPIESRTGEICVRGPQVMQGYWNRPEDSASAIRDGWLMTGDIGHMDAQGYLYITDRKKDMVLVSGFNVYPNEVEETLSTCPGLLETAVIGVPDAKTGEAVKAFVVRKNPALDEAAVIAHCRARLTSYKVPRQVEFRDSLPKSPVGKILRRELRDPAKP